jgi:hypothetical protein
MGLLYANGVGTALERGEPVTFNYTSQLCVLKIKVTSEDDYIDLNLADPQLTLSMPVTANFDLSEGRHTDYQTGPLELDAVQSSATEASWKTFVIPHAEYSQWETDRTFTFTFGQTPNEQTHTFYLPVDFKFIAGHNYELEFEVKKPSLALPDDGKANCFMVEPGERFTFKTARAYEEEGVSNTTLRTGGDYANGKFEAAVLWDDADVIRGVIVKGAGPATEVTIITDTEKKPSGNAAVKVYKKNDPEKLPVWSYHIWVTDYEPVVGVNTWTNPYNTSFTFMDRNLGATACNYLLNSVATYGLLYQWGRKDPFPGSAPGSAGWDVLHRFEGLGGAGTIPANNNDEAIKESIRHPERFYLRNTTNNNWLPAIDNKLWNPTDGTKSVYDPCPSGWCVPKQKNNLESSSPWYGYASTSNEAKWGSWVIYDYYRGMVLITESYIPAYYPASGYRNGNGNAGGAGSEGCLYVGTETSTDINDIGVLRLYYNASGTFVFSTDGATTSRSNGYSVRCVKYS